MSSRNNAVIARALRTDDEAALELLREYSPIAADESWLSSIGVSTGDVRELVEAGASHHPALALFRSARGGSVKISKTEVAEILGKLAPASPGPLAALEALTAGLDATINPAAPWKSGYSLGREIRARLNVAIDVNIDLEALVIGLGVDIHDIPLQDTSVRGVAVAAAGKRPAAFVNLLCPDAAGPSGRRTTLAHELCHFLFDRSRMSSLATFEVPRASERLVEMRANAFAVELLVPRANLLHLLHASPAEQEVGLDDIGAKYGVSLAALRKHFENARREADG